MDTAGVAKALGFTGRVNGGVYQVNAPRPETIRENGMTVPASMGLGSVMNFQPTGGGKAAITGDFVCHSQLWLDALAELIARYHAPVVCVLGNHDHWSGGEEVRRTLLRAGAGVLDNVHTTITLRGERLQLVGLDDAYTGHADWQRAVHGLRQDLPTLGLSHIAEEADHLWTAGVSLVLSGHTHAGQVTLARLNELALGRVIGHRYIHGIYGSRAEPRPRGAVYVGAGIGAAVLPLRLGERARREVTIFELGAPVGSFAEHHDDQHPLPGRPPSERVQAKRIRKVEDKQAGRDRIAARKAARGTRGE